ncbi:MULTISPECIES: helix-turn-helix transcriptional regulator [unclassified Streptomyces]|uniref:helix-turn-helix transcriptional regulator n=1 Tax=unclassified Streptomyces TaxID=2593676 RepID=UPI0028C4EA0E|nr:MULTISPECIES: PAS domain-containing protein [unclassified Streptomyces]WNO76415.1 PAS domain-containing protein [Streptomyces sp. AM8-1-1]
MSAASGDHERAEDELLLREGEKIVVALGRMFPGLCEVVLHDLRYPDHAVRAIENNLSGRTVGDPATELGLARIADPDYPSVLQNYPNRFPDGRPAKSTSIGLKNSRGHYVAAICLNLDVSLFATAARSLAGLVRTEEPDVSLEETLRARSSGELRAAVEEFSAARGQTPRSLDGASRRELVRSLKERGFLEVKHSVQALTDLLGISRATVYNYLR